MVYYQYALIGSDRIDTIRRYLPSNFAAEPLGTFTLIFGQDRAGFTLDGYVLPRMAQWGLGKAVGVRATYDGEGTFSLIDPDNEPGAPVDELLVFTIRTWEEIIKDPAQRPADDGEPFGDWGVEREVTALIAESNVRWALDPAFDSQEAADYANEYLGRSW